MDTYDTRREMERSSENVQMVRSSELIEKDKYIAEYLMPLSAETLRFMVADHVAEIKKLEARCAEKVSDININSLLEKSGKGSVGIIDKTEPEIKLENRYIVFKISELSCPESIRLRGMADEINNRRRKKNKAPLRCVVVESDWPEYKSVVDAIESRVFATEER